MLNYLQDYKEHAFSLYNSTSSSSSSKQQQAVTKNNIQPTIIDGVKLPIFENHHGVLEQPFLSLPKELSSYHRSIVHDICTDTVDLFHCGVDGPNEGERFVAVSIYSDGLAQVVRGIVPTDCLRSTTLQVENYRPWIMKKGVDSRLETGKGKKIISEMIDQPGRCLRDGRDTIDLLQCQGDTLSTIQAPELGDTTTCTLVDTAELMQKCIQDLEDNKPTEIAFDLECYNKRKEQQMTCLIQLATNDGRTYIIDVLGGNHGGEVWDRVHGLAKFFADRTIVKIGHGIRGLDIQSLQRDFGIFVVNAFDTYEAANVLQLEGKGLATICAHYGLQNSELYNDLKCSYQATDWTKRPLTGPMILYGRYDVHYLISLRKLMMRDLVQSAAMSDVSLLLLYQQQTTESSTVSVSSSLEDMICAFNKGDGGKNEEVSQDISNTNLENANDTSNNAGRNNAGLPVTKKHFFRAQDLRMYLGLMQVLLKSQENCLKFWSSKPEPPLKNKQFLSLAAQYRKDGKAFTKSQLSLYYKLASWREEMAMEEELLPGMILSLDYLARVAFHRPSTENGLRKINYTIPRFFIKHNRRYTKMLFSFVRDSLADDNVVEDDVYPTFEEFKEQLAKKKMMELLSIEESGTNGSTDKSIISNPIFWAVSCATISVLICGFIGDRKRRRC
jgi:ribonuclease D